MQLTTASATFHNYGDIMEFVGQSGQRGISSAGADKARKEHSSGALLYRREAAGTLKKCKKRKNFLCEVCLIREVFSFLAFFQSVQRSGRMFAEGLLNPLRSLRLCERQCPLIALFGIRRRNYGMEY